LDAKEKDKEKISYVCLSVLTQPKDQWDSNSYAGSSCYMSCSDDELVNLLASHDNNKENYKKIVSKAANQRSPRLSNKNYLLKA
jgi:hypothetical protein